MRILVTGAAGFIGSHVCEYLINTGETVVGVDNFDKFYSRLVKEQNLIQLKKSYRYEFYNSDIRDG
jgi:UDP-glucuronate 4-epimerase